MHLMNFIGLIQYLTPAILTGSLDCQHAQIFYGKLSIVVSPCGREKEIGHCCKVSDEAAFCLIQRPYISKTLLTRRISPRGSP